jgi:hypothetical protein
MVLLIEREFWRQVVGDIELCLWSFRRGRYIQENKGDRATPLNSGDLVGGGGGTTFFSWTTFSGQKAARALNALPGVEPEA